jgi:mono/diheme cytochrome c family protein
MMQRRLPRAIACASLVALALAEGVPAIDALTVFTRGSAQSAAIDEGRRLYNTYCASCHGTTGVGNGPVAPFMRRPPPDITNMAAANGGMFPTERVRRIVDGREVEAHGDREMPVWGDAFKVATGQRAEQVRARIDAIVSYLSSIQKHRAQ